MKERTARCCCGDTWITFRGEPERVIVCHCLYCQRRTGSVFNVSAWFFEEQIVARKTDHTGFINDTENNPGIDYTFCLRCGSTVYWPIKVRDGYYGAHRESPPGLYGVAVGCFEDPDFPGPTWDFAQTSRHRWVQPLGVEESYEGFPPPEKFRPNAAHLVALGRRLRRS